MNCPVFFIIIVHLYVCIQENYTPTVKVVLATRVRTIIALTMDLVKVRFSLLNISKTRLLFDFWVPMAKCIRYMCMYINCVNNIILCVLV